ncbi:MAG: sulfotransferase family 2 domain-containing protein [Gammaproteobacteria bacterium]
MGVVEDCRSLELISLHIPKSGGSALGIWLELVYGKEAVYFDSNENPQHLGHEYHIDPESYLEKYSLGYPFLRGKKAVHGHIWTNKYRYIENVPRITFIRDPLDRIISDYWNAKIFSEGRKNGFFDNNYPGAGLARKYRSWRRKLRVRQNPMQVYFFNNKPSILEYAHIPLKRYFYCETFFGDFGPERYDFIGDYSNFSDEMARLKNFLGVSKSYPLPQENVTSGKADGYKQFKEGVLDDPVTMTRLKELLADDLDFYQKHAGK